MSTVAIKTKHAPWIRYRTIAANDTLLTNTTKKGANVPSHVYSIPEAMNNIEVRFAGDSSGGSKTATVYFYGARYLDRDAGTWDDISLIGTANITTGAQLSTDNLYYADTVVLTDRWITEVKVADGNGNDGMSRIAFDASGYDGFFMQVNPTDNIDWIIDLSGW